MNKKIRYECNKRNTGACSASVYPCHKKKKAFTLAETILAVVIIGIIAAIFIPNAVRNATQKSYKAKLKKALYMYDTAVQKMIIENNISTMSTLESLSEDHCAESSKFFKKKQKDGNNSCIFETYDGLWWNITDITRVCVAFNKRNLSANKAASPDNIAFFFITTFSAQGSSFSTNNIVLAEGNDYNYMKKLYSFIEYK